MAMAAKKEGAMPSSFAVASSGAEQRLEVLAPSLVGLLCQQCGAVRNAILLPPSSDGRATPFACSPAHLKGTSS